jgi:3-dehydroquinate dehydratase/shikimate dehydrogenase
VSVAEADLGAVAARLAGLHGADLVEVRLDALAPPVRLETARLVALVAGSPVPIGFTLRPAWEGGGYLGDEPARRRQLEAAAASGAAFIDVELDAEWAAELVDSSPCPVIVSHHFDRPMPDDLDRRVEEMLRLRPSLAKLVAPSERPADAVPLLAAARRLIESGQPASGFCMGEAGRASRLLAIIQGAGIVYAAAEVGGEVAPGQWPLVELTERLRVRGWPRDAGLCGLIGHPIGHSLSPAIYNAVFQERGRGLAYLPLPGAQLAPVMDLVEAVGFIGLSVTMPFKEQMAARCAELDALAATTGAVNTVVARPGGGWAGFNTDGVAVVEALAARRQIGGAAIAIVGAGGAGRAAAVALAAAGGEVTVLNRTVARAEEVAELARCAAGPIDTLRERRFDVVINATPVGMRAAGDGNRAGAEAGKGGGVAGAGRRGGGPGDAGRGDEGGAAIAGPTASTPFPSDWLSGSEVVFDMVYRPRITPLLAAADARGCATIEGLEMFVRQAAVQYGLLTGDPSDQPLVSLRAAAERALDEDGGASR